MRKRIIGVVIMILMCLSLCACGKEKKEQLFVETMETLYEKSWIVISYNSTIINAMMEMNQDGRLSDYYTISLFSTEEDSFEKYKSIYEERPWVMTAECYEVMTKYFNIYSQEDLDNWKNRTIMTVNVLEELKPLEKDLRACKGAVNKECFNAAMECYESAENLASQLMPYSESEIYSYMEESINNIENINAARDTINLYYELNPDLKQVTEDMLGN